MVGSVLPAWTLPVPPRSSSDVQGAAHAILRRAEFASPHRSLPAAAWHWVSEHIGRWLDDLGGGAGGARLGWLGVVAAVAAATGAIVWAVRHRERWGGRPRRTHGVVVSDVGAPRPLEAWLAEAAGCEARGAWQGCVRARYRALLAALVQRGVTDERPGRTSGEYLRRVSARLPEAADAMKEATGCFEECWYGHKEAGPAESAKLARLTEQILAAADGRKAPRGRGVTGGPRGLVGAGGVVGAEAMVGAGAAPTVSGPP